MKELKKNITYLALYDLFFNPELPHAISISESVRLARKFSTTKGAAFVNALLDQLFKYVRQENQPLTLQETLKKLEERDVYVGETQEKQTAQ